MKTILVVDDEPLQRDILKEILEAAGYETYTAGSGSEAVKIAEHFRPSVVLTDLKMEDMDGVELLEELKKTATESGYEPTIIIMTAHGTIKSAVDAVKKGAFDYLTKPLEKENLLLTIKRAQEHAGLIRENTELKRQLFGKFSIEGIVGNSPKMKEIADVLRKVSPTNASVLILGESGTGKELVARAIHYNSPRRLKPFVALNCSAIPENLFESELFGYEPGAFTGAVSRKEGLIECSSKGTLFLDEVADMPPPMQAKLLRVLEEKEVRRLGGKTPIRVDLRVISATNKDIEREVSEGRFREDLYYRLKVIAVELPPLRKRKEDIPELTRYFIEKYKVEFGKRIKDIEPSALKMLCEYDWPGNIRELEHIIERAVLMSETDTIRAEDISGELKNTTALSASNIDIPDEGLDFEALEKELLQKALSKSGGVASKAARLLGMSYKAFLYRLEKFGIDYKRQ